MLLIENISKSYGRQVIFEDVSFTVNPGERIGVVGRNGHGKTTLFRLIIGEEHPDSGAIRIPAGYVIGHLSQHLRFTEKTVLSEACSGLASSGDGTDESYRVKSILMGLGFSEEDFPAPPGILSGGYQIRLKLARLLASGPNLLLLDEPTNYLDIVSIRWLSRFLRNWKSELMIITHDRSFMDSVTTHILGIHRQHARKIEGPTEKLYSQLLLEEEHYEKTRLNDERKRREAEQFINRFRAQATRARAVQSRIKALGKIEVRDQLSEISSLDFTFRQEEFRSKWVVDSRNISFSFTSNGRPLIENLSLTVGSRDRIAVIGKNGRGKTTLLNLLAGEIEPSAGTISRHPQLKLAYFGQTNIERLNPEKTVEEEILDAMPEHDRRAARGICGLMMFEGDHALKRVRVLSGGEKSRVLLGKLLVHPVHLLLLDEPNNHLDMESTEALLEALEEFKGAVVIVTHNEMILHSFPERLVVFDNDQVRLFEGTYQEFLDRMGWAEETGQQPAKQEGRGKPNRSRYRRDVKRLRAELINSRSRVIGDLNRRISETEETIMRLEKEVSDNNAGLILASSKGDWQSITSLTRSNRMADESIERHFGELAVLTDELNRRSREFDDELKVLSSEPGEETVLLRKENKSE